MRPGRGWEHAGAAWARTGTRRGGRRTDQNTPGGRGTEQYTAGAREPGPGPGPRTPPSGARPLRAARELQVHHPVTRDRAYELQAVEVGAHALEEPLPAAEQYRHDVELHLVDQARRQVLVRHVRASAERHVAAAGRAPRQLERRLDAVGDERERGAVVELEALAAVVRDHEDGVLEGRLLAPPAAPRVRGVPGPGPAAEHAAAHDRGADVRGRLAQQLVGAVHLPALQAVRLAPRPQPDDPLVQPLPAAAQGLLAGLVGPRHVAV